MLAAGLRRLIHCQSEGRAARLRKDAGFWYRRSGATVKTKGNLVLMCEVGLEMGEVEIG